MAICVAVVGAGGMLGRAIMRELQVRSTSVVALTRAECDVTSSEQTREVFERVRPTVVINCAGYTDVNGAELNEQVAHLVNAVGAENVALAAASQGARCIYVSTDYVFDGRSQESYREHDPTGPLNAYGRTKLEGELRVAAAHPLGYAVFRTSWLYGAGGKNFVDTMLRLGREQKDLRVVDDQVGSPTWVAELARLLADCAFAEPHGIYHATCRGSCSWYDFAREIFRLAQINPHSLMPVKSSEFPAAALRPANSRLESTRLSELSVQPMPYWEEALKRYLQSLQESHIL